MPHARVRSCFEFVQNGKTVSYTNVLTSCPSLGHETLIRPREQKKPAL